jgi:hypothetical protein
VFRPYVLGSLFVSLVLKLFAWKTSSVSGAPLKIIEPSCLHGAAPDCGLVPATVANTNTAGGGVIAVIPSVPGRARIQ